MADSLDARARRIFDEALDLRADERAPLLDRACASDLQLRDRVLLLLSKAEEDDPFLSVPTIMENPSRSRGAGERPGTRIGPYKLLEAIGEGGFGTVFMAEQTEPVRRRVALKIIKLGMDTRAVVARFEQERQALALMDHPNVAKVLDAGETETGRPYFVMELVKGKPITGFCDEVQLSIPDRLELFTQVCRAVQHAHTKGIIHRDIKPTNVLVSEQDGRPACKIIDFGIAKATQQPLTEKTVFTEFRQLIGTPEYMSPEQAAGSLDIDTRSDVYSLGVLLYELLAGVTPIDPVRLRSAAYAEMQRIIREVDPPAPSTRLSQAGEQLASVAATRRTEPGRLGSIIRGELDWIVMRALEKDRARRYDSPGNLAADIQRYLQGEPVEAAPPNAVYRLNKFVSRHRGPVMAASAVAAALVIGLGLALWQAMVAQRERDAARLAAVKASAAETEARARRDETEKIAEFQSSQLRDINAAMMGEQLRGNLLVGLRERMKSDGAADATIAETETRLAATLDQVSMTDAALAALDEQVFARALTAIESQFRNAPLIKARLLLTLGGTMIDLGLLARAEEPISEALAIRTRELGPDADETLDAALSTAHLQFQRGELDLAEQTARKNLDDRRRVLGPESRDALDSLNVLASILQAQRRLGEAEPLFREGLAASRRVFGPDDELAVLFLNNVGSVLMQARKDEEAEPITREAHERMVRVHGADHPYTLFALANIGLVLMDLNRLKEAEPILREVYERRRIVQGASHKQTVASLMDCGLVLRAQGRFSDAEPIYREVLARRTTMFGLNNPDTLSAMNNLGALLMSLERYDQAETILRETLERRRALFGDTSVPTLRSLNILGRALLKRGKPNEAEPLFREALAGFSADASHDKLWLAEAHSGLGSALAARSRFAEAERSHLDAMHALESANNPSRTLAIAMIQETIGMYEAWEKAEPGKGHGQKAAPWRERLGQLKAAP
ncbi:MAG: serine/threonine protein kinase [Phycisphaerales bacterium]|nr:serine/threonine protein kinase [Phycisphaerales bacterium]